MKMTNFIIDTTQIALSSAALLEQLPYAIGIKTQDSIFVAANHHVAKIAGFKDAKKMIGFTDKDVPCQASELYEEFVKQDKEALAETKIVNLDVCRYSDQNLHVFISTKNLLLDNNHQKFVLFTMVELPILMVTKIFNDMNGVYRKSNEIIGSYSVKNPIIQSKNATPLTLSPRLTECLFYLLRGQSMKEIASKMKISSRTVEEHIIRLKDYFNCYSKSQLIEKAISLGYVAIIPPSLLCIPD